MSSNICRFVLAIGWLFTIATIPVQTNAAEPLEKPAKPTTRNPNVDKVASSINRFGFELYEQLSEEEGNIFFSPASISTALAMTYAGAEGETESQMAQVLHFTDDGAQLPRESFHEAFGALSKLLNSDEKQDDYQLSMANRLWGQKTFPFVPEFLGVTRQNYGAELAKVDFAETEQARQQINAWVEEQTNGKIENLIPSGVLDSQTRLVLTNAIYFKGTWDQEFSKKATKDAPFHLSQDREVEVSMMHQTDDFRYAETADLQLLELPYAGEDLAMVILLPKKIEELADLKSQLPAENVRQWSDKLQEKEVRVYLPKFKVTAQFQLADTLRAMGMTLPFSDQADFSGISTAEELLLSEVIHKAFVNVDEEGTEAAAATAAVFAPTAAVEPEEPAVFRADHPFVFLIQDTRTDTILFMGRVVNPKE